MCGEHSTHQGERSGSGGSSPRVRGTRYNFNHARAQIRFIPACAGNTITEPFPMRMFPVHPRVCGEHAKAILKDYEGAGSSPRVRGTPDCSRRRVKLQRFIPACAGNTQPHHGSDQKAPVHPRVCGEHAFACVRYMGESGSSPRVRGTRGLTSHSIVRVRFIPACARNTVSGQ